MTYTLLDAVKSGNLTIVKWMIKRGEVPSTHHITTAHIYKFYPIADYLTNILILFKLNSLE
jgi:hypothetical protein